VALLPRTAWRSFVFGDIRGLKVDENVSPRCQLGLNSDQPGRIDQGSLRQ